MSVTDPDLEEVCGLAARWARDAGEVALSRFGTPFSTSLKHDASVLTDVDLELQNLIIDHVSSRFPDHGIVAEEQGGSRAASPAQRWWWVVDPLDGTRNFARGLRFYSVSVALLRDGEPVVGVIHDPVGAVVYTAIAGRGAWMNDRAIRVSESTWTNDVVLGISARKNTLLPPVVFTDWLKRASHRTMGSACLLMALTACGAVDACFGLRAKLWDIAAGSLMIAEAGGVMTTPQGQPLFPVDVRADQRRSIDFLAGNRAIHADLQESLRTATSSPGSDLQDLPPSGSSVNTR